MLNSFTILTNKNLKQASLGCESMSQRSQFSPASGNEKTEAVITG